MLKKEEEKKKNLRRVEDGTGFESQGHLQMPIF